MDRSFPILSPCNCTQSAKTSVVELGLQLCRADIQIGDDNMETMDAIRSRRAVREYTDAKVERAVVERLVDAAVLAPSAMNLQPWAFAALVDRKRVSEYSERIKSWLLANFSETSLDPSLREHIQTEGFSVFHGAPALVLILAKSSLPQAVEDCCLAVQNLMLAARDEGLGTCWIGLARPWLNLPSTKREIGLPEHFEIVAPIILGHPTAWPESHGRLAAEIHWIG
jgi:nitroreductase